MKITPLFLFVLFLSIIGCQDMSVRDARGAAALTTQGVAEAVQAECASAVPDGPCVAGSRISTTDKQQIKKQLQDVNKAQDAATTLYASGDTQGALSSLAAAHQILAGIEQLLANRGIQNASH